MHDSVLQFVRASLSSIVVDGGSLLVGTARVLEVGSLDVNGSVRPLFSWAGTYVGLDAREGPGVDVVAEAKVMPFNCGAFDIVVCTEMLEHDPTFWLSVKEMGRVLRDGGFLILTARGIGFPHHDEPIDCYRFTLEGFRSVFAVARCDRELHVEEDPQAAGVFGRGRRFTATVPSPSPGRG